jgi:hypothetical protein
LYWFTLLRIIHIKNHPLEWKPLRAKVNAAA